MGPHFAISPPAIDERHYYYADEDRMVHAVSAHCRGDNIALLR